MDVFLVCELRMAGSGVKPGRIAFTLNRTQRVLLLPGGSDGKNLTAMQETRVQALGQEDPLKKGMATHFSILAWEIPWTEKPGGLQSMGSQRIGLD